jgi:hypothetical protein
MAGIRKGNNKTNTLALLHSYRHFNAVDGVFSCSDYQ